MRFALVALLVAIYNGCIFYSRWSAESALRQKQLKALGGGELKILNFYAHPGTIHRGDTAKICYSVVGAKKLELDPPVEEVWPALSRCFDVKPTKTMSYRLTAEEAGGQSTVANLTLEVR
jgi:hypothetical protein